MKYFTTDVLGTTCTNKQTQTRNLTNTQMVKIKQNFCKPNTLYPTYSPKRESNHKHKPKITTYQYTGKKKNLVPKRKTAAEFK